MIPAWLKEWIAEVPTLIKMAVLIIACALIYTYVGAYGALGFIAATLLVVAVYIWLQRGTFINSIRYVETQIWGRPLDRKYWKEGEEYPKVKILWKKKRK